MNEIQHSTLLVQNSNIIFTLNTGSVQNKDDRLDITFSYTAFDLTTKPPFAGLNEILYYFPLKQTANEMQYTLGRTFLQETYMIADYDRVAFSLFPAVFPKSDAETRLISIEPPKDMSPVTITKDGPKNGLSEAVTVDIIVGTVIPLLLVVAVIVFRIRRGRRQKVRKEVSGLPNPWEKPELAGDRTYDRSEIEGRMINDPRYKLPTSVDTTEWHGSRLSSGFRSPLQEMPPDPNSSGLCPPRPIHELF